MFDKVLIAGAAAFLISCGDGPVGQTGNPEEEWVPGGPVQNVVLPDGDVIEAVLRIRPEEITTGMKYRHFIPPDKGMLFVFPQPAAQAFFMFECVVPLDILWIDNAKRIVEMQRNAPPCFERDLRKCPNYGGNQVASYVLEIAAGQAVAHGLELGDVLEF